MVLILKDITMHFGINYNNDGIGGNTDRVLRQIPDNITRYVLSRSLRAVPGTEYHYNDGDPQLLSAVIQSSTGKPVDSWADEVFFSRIGMSRYNWIRYRDGTTMGGFGIETTAIELGKIGLCVSNMGSYSRQQVVPSEWIKEMTGVKTTTDLKYKFGYYWWIDSSRQIHFTWGHEGQFVVIVPGESMVIVMTSIPNTQGSYQVDADEAFRILDLIKKACN